MTRETRLLAILLALAVGGVTLLAIVANQYRGKLAPGGADATRRAERLVDGFVASRQAVHHVADQYGDKLNQVAGAVTGDFHGVAGQKMGYGIDVIAAYKTERYNAFTAYGMTYEDYAAVRSAWRAWKSGTSPLDASMANALEKKRAALAAADLGSLEVFDDAIK